MVAILRMVGIGSSNEANSVQPTAARATAALAAAIAMGLCAFFWIATAWPEGAGRQIAADITELYLLGTSLRFDTSPHRPDIGMIRAFDRKIVALLPLSECYRGSA